MNQSIDPLDKNRRARGQKVVDDRLGRIQRTDTRAAFWRLLRRLDRNAVAELLDIEIARQKLATWPDHVAAHPDAPCWLINSFQQGHHSLPWPGGVVWDHEMFDWKDELSVEVRERWGPLWHWPFNHVDEWCRRYDLFSPALRADAAYTLTQNFRVVNGEPTLVPFAIPTHVTVCRRDAERADDWINGRRDPSLWGTERIFDERDRNDLLSDVTSVTSMTYPVELSFDEQNEWLREYLHDVAEHHADVLARRRERRRERPVSVAVTVPHDERILWFIRSRVKHEPIEEIAEKHQKTTRAVEKAKGEVTKLLELPRQRRHPEHESRIDPSRW